MTLKGAQMFSRRLGFAILAVLILCFVVAVSTADAANAARNITTAKPTLQPVRVFIDTRYQFNLPTGSIINGWGTGANIKFDWYPAACSGKNCIHLLGHSTQREMEQACGVFAAGCAVTSGPQSECWLHVLNWWVGSAVQSHIMVHEAGHCFGLPHNSRLTSVMFCCGNSANDQIYIPDAIDKANVRANYPLVRVKARIAR